MYLGKYFKDRRFKGKIAIEGLPFLYNYYINIKKKYSEQKLLKIYFSSVSFANKH